MRKALNDNPVVQIGALLALALLVGFLLITRMSHKSSESSTSTTASDSSAAVAPTSSSSDPTAAATSSAAPTAPDATAAPAPTAPSGAVAPTGKFVAGPGLPAPVVQAYNHNQVVVLLVVRRNGIDDDAVKAGAEAVAGASKVALFVTNAGHIARYSRIAAGVNVDRVPALIVLRPRNLTDGGLPQATVSYGFRGVDSVAQAVRDALYKGPTDLPYYPK
jgi:cytoskeletal protein RodZ